MVLESENSKASVLASLKDLTLWRDMAEDVTCKYRAGMPAKISAYHKVILRPRNLILF